MTYYKRKEYSIILFLFLVTITSCQFPFFSNQSVDILEDNQDGKPFVEVTSLIPGSTFISPTQSLEISSRQNDWPQGKVLFHSNETGSYQIYLIENGGHARRLTDMPINATEASWSSDGTAVVFSGRTKDINQLSLFVMDTSGNGILQELPFSQPRLNWRADWSPDGNQLLFESNRDGNFDIYRVNVDGTFLVNLSMNPANDGDPDWSPDGDQIAFVSDRDGSQMLYLSDAAGSNAKALLPSGWDAAFPRWSPDGKQIAFASAKDGTVDIYVYDMDIEKIDKVTNRIGDNTMPSWVDNSNLLFSGDNGGGNWDIFQVNVDTSKLIQLTDTEYSERYPVWFPAR